MLESDRSFIAITQDIEQFAQQVELARAPNRVIPIITDKFLIEHAHTVIEEAYKAEEHLKTIILGAKHFGIDPQNALLKILEEPPRNISFVIITESKNALLPTVISRLFVLNDLSRATYEPFDFSLRRFELDQFFAFIIEHKNLKSLEAKYMLERLLYQAVHIDKITLSKAQMESFERGMKLLSVNVRASRVFTSVLMNFLVEAKYDHS